MTGAGFSFGAPWACAAGVALVAALMVVAWGRGLGFTKATVAFAVSGAALLALGAGLPAWDRPSEKWVAVLVDLSASTRGAAYRNRSAIEIRISHLLGKVPYRISYFADGAAGSPPAGDVLADVPSDKTTFPPPPGAAAVLLFSDCRFELPEQVAPTYVVVDPALEEVDDARVTSLTIRGNEASAAVSNAGKSRGVSMQGAIGGSTGIATGGSVVLSRRIAPGANRVRAELMPRDAWPENDALSANVPPPQTLERWWVGSGAAPAGWRAVRPSDMPVDDAAYLGAAVVVLDNVSSDDVPDVQLQRLSHYVLDAGGGLVLLGGDHAFGAGGYPGTILEALSPLASRPPEPTVHWVILVDQSGSMSGPVEGGGTRWDYAARAVKAVVAALPPEDLASVGGFAEGVDWWSQGKRVKDLAATPLPPGNAYPHGPTNLEPALESVERIGGTMPVQLLVISDFEAKISDTSALTTVLKARGVKLHLLAIGEGSALQTVTAMSSATGGTSMTQIDPTRWTSAARDLLRATLPKLVRTDAVSVRYTGPLAAEGGERATVWNRVWAKPGTTKLAEAGEGSEPIPMSAVWNVGQGRVGAAGFKPGPGVVDSMAKLVERRPRDPRFRVTWQAGEKVHVAVDAAENGKFLNDQDVTVEISDQETAGAAREVIRLIQWGPGSYEISIPAPGSPRLATVRVEGRVVERFALPGRYAPEFEGVGNDRIAMEELARRSGGRVIDPGDDQPIQIHWPDERVSLASEFGIAGAGLLLGALWWWRRS